jgi:hypothetical protein
MISNRSDGRGLPVAFVIALGAGLVACADLPPLQAGTCGNAVIDADEDCDGHVTSSEAACGAPGTAHACRYLCGASARLASGQYATCPSSFQCGTDGVCRQPTLAFRADMTPGALSSMALVSADFDGDQQPLLLVMGDDLGDGRRFARLVDPIGSTLGTGTAVKQPMSSPTVKDLDGDGHEDVAFVDYPGVGVLRGDPLGDAPAFLLLPSAAMSARTKHVRAIGVEIGQGPEGQNLGDQLLTLEDDGSALAAYRRDAHDSALADFSFTGKQVADLSGDLLHARFDTRPASLCDDVIVPLVGLGQLLYFSPCNATGWADPGIVPQSIALAPGNTGPATISGPAHIADLDGDGNLDVVVGTSLGPYVAYGRGDGSFASTSDPTGTAQTAAPLALRWLAGETPSVDEPLAMVDLNGDHRTDFVFPGGIALSDAAGDGSLYWAYQSPGWIEAAIGSGSHGAFVVAASVSVGLDVLQYAPDTGQLVDQLVPTATLAANLTVGDFDGDMKDDLAFCQESAVLGDTWSVVYDIASAPSAPVNMGTFAEIRQLSAAHLAVPYLGADGIADLVISADINSLKDTETVITSHGSSTRQMIAPFELRDPAGAQALPLGVAAGDFLGKPSIAALGAVDPQGSATLRVWTFSPGSIAASDLVVSDPLPSLFHTDHFGGNTAVNLQYGAHLSVGDLDGDGGDELVIIAPYGSPDTQSALVVATLANATMAFSDPVVFDGESTRYSFLQVADLDHDGRADVIFKPMDDDTPADVLVFWNGGNGRFTASSMSRIHVDEGLNAFACVHDGQGGCNLHVVSATNAYAVTVGSDRSTSIAQVAGLPGGLSLAAGDFDGDGLDDLAVGTVDELRVYHATSRLP